MILGREVQQCGIDGDSSSQRGIVSGLSIGVPRMLPAELCERVVCTEILVLTRTQVELHRRRIGTG
jgi:hypothetical protein